MICTVMEAVKGTLYRLQLGRRCLAESYYQLSVKPDQFSSQPMPTFSMSVLVQQRLQRGRLLVRESC
jgi:hypothetical protein